MKKQRYQILKYRLFLLSEWSQKGFTLIELIVVIFILGTLAAIALPVYLKQVEKARTTEATYTLASMNKAQQARIWEKGVFASDFSELELNMTTPQFYTFSWVGTGTSTEVRHLATPLPTYSLDLKTYTSAVFKDGNLFYSVMCQGNEVGDTPYLDDQTTCTDGEILGQ